MKKFFKALAVVLALTLLIGTIPASAAEGELVSMNKSSKTLYIGGSKALTADDAACKIYSKYKVTKLIDGFDADTMKLELASEDKTIVSTSNKTGRIYAKGIGTANVKVTVKNSDDTVIGTFDLKVTVKKNATADTLVIKSDEIADGVKVGINTGYTVVLPRKADGAFVDTDARNLTCDDKNVTIEKLAATTFKVTFNEVGEYTLKAAAFQSNKYPKYAEPIEKEIKVTAGLTAEKVELVSLNSVDVTFDCVISSLDTKNFGAYYLVKDTKVTFSSVKEIKKNEDVATVSFFSDFPADTDIVITYNGNDIGTVKSAAVTADSIATFEFVDQPASVGSKSSLSYRFLDADGVDITSSKELKGTLTFTLADATPYAQVAYDADHGWYIEGTKVGETYTVKGSYVYFKDGQKVEIPAEAKVNIVPLSDENYNVVGGVYSKDTIIKSDGSIDGDVKPVAHFTMKDTATYYFMAYVDYTRDGKRTKIEKLDDINANGLLYTVESSSNDIVMIGSKSNQGYVLIANQTGSAYIFVKNQSKETIGAFLVVVEGEKKADSLTVEIANSKSILNCGAEDSVEFVLSLKNQYFEGVNFSDPNQIVVEQQNGVKDIAKVNTSTLQKELVTDDNSKAKVTVKYTDIVDFTNAGYISLKFKDTVSGKEATAIFYVVKDIEGDVAAVQTLSLDKTVLDTAILENTKQSSVKISLAGTTAKGNPGTAATISYKLVDADEVKVSLKDNTDHEAEGINYYYTITKDGQPIESTEASKFLSGNELFAFTKDSLGKISKVPTGTYTVIAYKREVTAARIQVSAIDTKSFTVKDTQVALLVNRAKDQYVNNENECFTFSFNGNTVNASKVRLTGNSIGDGGVAFIGAAEYDIENTVLPGTFTVVTGVNQSVNQSVSK